MYCWKRVKNRGDRRYTKKIAQEQYFKISLSNNKKHVGPLVVGDIIERIMDCHYIGKLSILKKNIFGDCRKNYQYRKMCIQFHLID